MPPKIRELSGDLERAGFVDRSGKGSHRKFTHPRVEKPVIRSFPRALGTEKFFVVRLAFHLKGVCYDSK